MGKTLISYSFLILKTSKNGENFKKWRKLRRILFSSKLQEMAKTSRAGDRPKAKGGPRPKGLEPWLP